MKKAKLVVLSLFLLALVLSAAAGASEFWPSLFKLHNRASVDNADVAAGTKESADLAAADPAAILLLGAGLVSLGLYAKQKHRKWQ